MEIAEYVLPREKLLALGVDTLTDDELLALFLRTGTPGKDVFALAKEILEHFGSLYSLLTADYSQFSSVTGIGVAKYAQLKGIAELARRFYEVQIKGTNPLLSPVLTRDFLQSQFAGEAREIIREAIKINASAVILAHNHPSGCAEPSKADKLITDRVVKCCQFMDIRVLDHLVIGRGEYVSFAERGWI